MNGDKLTGNMSDTTLRCSIETRDRIAGLGGKDDTFEDILKQLVKEHYELVELKKKKQ
jgi:hypothetical protein